MDRLLRLFTHVALRPVVWALGAAAFALLALASALVV